MKITKYAVRFTHFIVSSFIAALAAILMHTQMVLADLNAIDISIPIADRFYMMGQDILGLLPKYGIVVLLGLAIAFVIAKLIVVMLNKKSPQTKARRYLYPLAGGVAILAILLLMQPILNITLLAGARSLTGMALQILAGVLGGVIFAYLGLRKKSAY